MSYGALGIGVVLFLAATVSGESFSSSSSRSKSYQDKDTNVKKQSPQKAQKQEIKAFAQREDLKIEKDSDSLKESKKKLEKELEGVQNDGRNNDIAAPVF